MFLLAKASAAPARKSVETISMVQYSLLFMNVSPKAELDCPGDVFCQRLCDTHEEERREGHHGPIQFAVHGCVSKCGTRLPMLSVRHRPCKQKYEGPLQSQRRSQFWLSPHPDRRTGPYDLREISRAACADTAACNNGKSFEASDEPNKYRSRKQHGEAIAAMRSDFLMFISL